MYIYIYMSDWSNLALFWVRPGGACPKHSQSYCGNIARGLWLPYMVAIDSSMPDWLRQVNWVLKYGERWLRATRGVSVGVESRVEECVNSGLLLEEPVSFTRAKPPHFY